MHCAPHFRAELPHARDRSILLRLSEWRGAREWGLSRTLCLGAKSALARTASQWKLDAIQVSSTMKRIAIGSVISCAMFSLAAAAPAGTGPDSMGVASCVINPKRVVQLGSPAEDVDKYRAMVNQDQIAIRKAEADLHIAALEAIRSERQLNLKFIRSSINGVVTERKLSPGEHVYEQTPILTIAEINPLYVELVVNAEQYPFFRVGMTAELHPGAPAGGVYSASVDVVDPVIDAGSNTFRVRLVLPNPKNAIPAGVRCTVRLPNKTPKN
jgi:multidrug efflux pump subunit AcrA (membrane-fusion protein)